MWRKYSFTCINKLSPQHRRLHLFDTEQVAVSFPMLTFVLLLEAANYLKGKFQFCLFRFVFVILHIVFTYYLFMCQTCEPQEDHRYQAKCNRLVTHFQNQRNDCDIKGRREKQQLSYSWFRKRSKPPPTLLPLKSHSYAFTFTGLGHRLDLNSQQPQTVHSGSLFICEHEL